MTPHQSTLPATFHLGAESPDVDSMPDDDALDSTRGSPILGGSCIQYSTDERSTLQAKTLKNLSDMKQELLNLQDQVRDKQNRIAKITHEVIDDQTEIEKLENKIHLAEFLCQLPSDVQTHGSSSMTEPLQLDLQGSAYQDLSMGTVGAHVLAHPSPDLTFSPSDQTLVELGQRAAVESNRLASTLDEDVEMLDPMSLVASSSGSPGNPELQRLEASDLSESMNLQSSIRSPLPPSSHNFQSRKRRRLSGFFSSSNIPPIASSGLALTHECPSATDSGSDTKSLQQSRKSAIFRVRSRRSRMLLDQLSALQTRLESIGKPRTGASQADAERPVSYPQSQRWRMSLGVSVKSITEGFERMRLRQRDAKVPKAASN